MKPWSGPAWGLAAGVLAAAAVVSLSAQAPLHPAPKGTGKDALAQVNAALQAGEADHALALLQALPQSGPQEAEAHNLECRVLYTLEQWNRAVSACEQAVKAEGENSAYHLWLGRALGEKADRASFMSAYSLGKRVRVEFEEAVRLNPRNAEALSDLGEFYETAPGVVGGGLDKAEKIAEQLDKVDAARAHELRGRIAEERKDYGTAEREYKQAIGADAHPAFQWMTLASFYRRRERWPEMEAAVQSGIGAVQRDRSAGAALCDGAGVLTRANRNPELAAKMLEEYLAGSFKTEKAPSFQAHLRLARVKEQLGDREAAQRERAAAFALAHDFKPAQDAKH
jgi:tetratricopeptide (TPR) repeat protein